MATYIKTLKDVNGDVVLPRTRVEAITMGDGTTQLSDHLIEFAEYFTDYADTAVANLVNSAPSTLDTLNELAQALGDDPNFATTVANNIATKANIASPTFTGTVTGPTINASTALQIGGVAITATAAELNYTDGVTSNIQTQLGTKAPLESPALTGTPTATTAAVGTNTTQIATTAFVNSEIANDATRKSASTGTVVNYIWSGTLAEYNAIATKDANTLYFIV